MPLYKHDHLNAYPVKAVDTSGSGLKLDGNLADWDSRAFVEMYSDPQIKEFFSTKVAVAYDASALWLACKVTDASPLVNHVDPAVDAFSGWRGDALQFRMIANPAITTPIPDAVLKSDNIIHCTAWYFTDKQLPCLDVRYGMDYHTPSTFTGADSGFLYKAVPGGYEVEARIPWTTLRAKAPVAGQRWMFTIQPLWGDSAGRYQHSFFDVMHCLPVASTTA